MRRFDREGGFHLAQNNKSRRVCVREQRNEKTRMESDAEEFILFFRKKHSCQIGTHAETKIHFLISSFSCHKSFQRQRLSKGRQKMIACVIIESSKTERL